MKTFTPNSKSLGNCSTWMVSPLTCSINLFVASSTIFSNPNLLYSLFLRKSSIFAFFSLVHIPSRFALKLHDFVVLLILISTFALSFALLHASPLSFLLRIEFPSFWGLVLHTYSSVDAVRIVCRSRGHLSYNRKTIIQSSHVQHVLPPKNHRSHC